MRVNWNKEKQGVEPPPEHAKGRPVWFIEKKWIEPLFADPYCEIYLHCGIVVHNSTNTYRLSPMEHCHCDDVISIDKSLSWDERRIYLHRVAVVHRSEHYKIMDGAGKCVNLSDSHIADLLITNQAIIAPRPSDPEGALNYTSLMGTEMVIRENVIKHEFYTKKIFNSKLSALEKISSMLKSTVYKRIDFIDLSV